MLPGDFLNQVWFILVGTFNKRILLRSFSRLQSRLGWRSPHALHKRCCVVSCFGPRVFQWHALICYWILGFYDIAIKPKSTYFPVVTGQPSVREFNSWA